MERGEGAHEGERKALALMVYLNSVLYLDESDVLIVF